METDNFTNGTDYAEFNLTAAFNTPGSGNYFVFPLWFSILIVILNAVIVCLNVVHITIVARLPSLNKAPQQNYKFFLLSLAVIDIVACICNCVLSPPQVQEFMKTSRLLCIAPAVILHSAYINMGFLTILVAIDRVLSIRLKLAYQQHCFVVHYRRFATAAAMAIVALYTSLAVVFRNKGYEPKGNGPCKMETRQAPALGLVTGALLYFDLAVLIVVYMVFLYMVRRYLVGKANRRLRESKEVAKVIGFIILSHIVSWTPPLTNLALRAGGMKIAAMEYVNILMMMVNSTANPLIYGVASTNYRRGLRRALNMAPLSEASRTQNEISNVSSASGDVKSFDSRTTLQTVS